MTKEKKPPNHTKKEQLLIASALVPLLFACKNQPDFLPLFYSLFVLAYFFSKKQTRQEKPTGKSLFIAGAFFSLNLTLLGAMAEALVLFNKNLNQSSLSQAPEVLLPQLVAIASGGVGFYLGWALAVCLVGKQFGFSLPLAIFSGLYPPLLALLPLPSPPSFNATDVSNPLTALLSLPLNSWQALILEPAPFSSILYKLIVCATLAGLAYLSSFGQLTTSAPALPVKPWLNRLRAIILLTISMSIIPWSLAWLFLQAAKLFKCLF